MEIWRVWQFEVPFHLSHRIKDFSLPMQLLLSLIQMSSSPCASSEASVVQPLQMDHRTGKNRGLTPPFLKIKKKEKMQKNLVVAEISTWQHRKYPSKVYSAGLELQTPSRSPNGKGTPLAEHQHHQDFIASYVNPSAHPPSNFYR